MNDSISRQSAIDAVSEGCQELRGIFSRCEANLLSLPPAHSERKKGKWRLATKPTDYFAGYRCSECNELVYGKTNYCPRCGADMRKGEE